MTLVDRLAALPELAGVPREQLQWLLEHAEHRRADGGTTFHASGQDVMGLYLLISGRLSVRVDQHGVTREVREVTPGRFTGLLPYSRMASSPRGYVVADGPIEYLWMAQEHVRELTRRCYEITELCVHEMLERVRTFKAEDKQQEKMAALGRLSAGLAHELNNPASAAARASRELDAARAEVVAASRALGAARLEGETLRTLESLEAAARRTPGASLTSMDRADLEDRIREWLVRHGTDADLAYPLAGSGLTIADLEAATPALAGTRLALVLKSVAADAALRGLTADLVSAAGRIHALVAAVKKHTHMDRAPTPEPIHLEEHLGDTVALMTSKAALKGLSLELSVEPGLPPVEGTVVDLNQVWLHLIDNAIDAGTESGRIVVDAARDGECVVVRVTDDGPGIPAGDQERVFEPFFTTKDVGQGRGLGLDIVRTVVRSHRGAVDVTSRPGRTEFRVVLPALGSGAET